MLLGSGYSLGSALNRLARRGDGACATDLVRVCGRMRQGLSEVDAAATHTVAVEPWSAETPRLYTAALHAGGSQRGGVLTQASVLKITANGTTTSPVPRGAFVMARLLGEEPDPPPPNIPAIEPDVRGAKTIREQLDKHRNEMVCASCHAKMDPPGFALESFDVIGGWRDRYRSIGDGDPAPRGSIDPFIGISFKLGPPVDASGVLPDERAFKDVTDFQNLIAADSGRHLADPVPFAVFGPGVKSHRGSAFSARRRQRSACARNWSRPSEYQW